MTWYVPFDRCVPISHTQIQFEVVLACVAPCHGDCVFGCIGCRYGAIAAFLLYRQGNGPGTGTQIQHARSCDETLECEFDE